MTRGFLVHLISTDTNFEITLFLGFFLFDVLREAYGYVSVDK